MRESVDCRLHINPSGILLSPTHVSSIVSVAALLQLGYAIHWTSEKCEVKHPVKGSLKVDVSSGCLEIEEATALELGSQYEALVTKSKVRTARVQRLAADLVGQTVEELVAHLQRGGPEAEA